MGITSRQVEPNEADDVAMVRELYEESGYRADQSELELLGVYNFTAPNGAINNFVTYRVRLGQPHQSALERSAHSEQRWVTAEECYAMPDLIFGLQELLELVGYIIPTQAKRGAGR